MTLGVLSFAHVAVLVSDLDRSAAWYEDVLGWERQFEHRIDDGSLGRANLEGTNGRIAMGQIGGVRLELVEMDEPKSPPTRPVPTGCTSCRSGWLTSAPLSPTARPMM